MNRKQRPADDYFVCPHCGSDVPAGAAFCRECGASDESGWEQDDYGTEEAFPDAYAPDADFDYDEFISREFPEYAKPTGRRQPTRWFTGLVVAIVCIAFLMYALAAW